MMVIEQEFYEPNEKMPDQINVQMILVDRNGESHLGVMSEDGRIYTACGDIFSIEYVAFWAYSFVPSLSDRSISDDDVVDASLDDAHGDYTNGAERDWRNDMARDNDEGSW